MKIALVGTSVLLSGGLPLISSLLKQAGHSVRSIFLCKRGNYEEREIQALYDVLKDVGLVMIGVYSTNAYRAVQVTEFVKEMFPGRSVIWGGPHCISAVETSLRYADGICYGEGDQCVVEFVEKFEAGDSDYLKTPNMAFTVNGSLVVNEALPPFQNLDELPFYDYNFNDHYILDNDLFLTTKEKVKEYSSRYVFGDKTALWTLTTRGCPHRCSYCNNSRYISMFGRNSIRRQSVERFMDELEASLKLLDFIEAIGFGDDDFLVRPERELREFGERYRKNVGLPFSVCFSARTFQKEKLEILLDAGLASVQMGVQSGSRRILTEVYNRNIPPATTKSASCQMASYHKTHGLELLLDFIIDNPYETEDDILDTYHYLLDVPSSIHVQIFKLLFFPGTPIYTRAVSEGIIQPFDERKRVGFLGSIEYQNNYANFLLCMLTLLHYYRLKRFFPKLFFRALSNRPVRAFFAHFPKPFWKFSIRAIRKLASKNFGRRVVRK